MIHKKFASLLVAGALITALGSASAFAAAPSADVPFCTVSGCTTTGDHQHDGTTYAAHYAGDGHTHTNCSVSGCSKTGDHTTHSGSHHGGSHNSHKGGHH